MAFCPYCGTQLSDDMRFCPNCGSNLAAQTTETVVQTAQTVYTTPVQTVQTVQPVQTVYTTPVQTVYTTPVQTVSSINSLSGNDYRLILLSCGSCSLSQAEDILEDVLGYTSLQVRTITQNLPMEIACNLNAEQALNLVQLLTEYGMQASVQNAQGPVDLSGYASTSVFDDGGSILSNVLKTLGGLGIVNRVRSFLRLNRADLGRYTFNPRYNRRPAPPRYVRRNLRHAPPVRHPQPEPNRPAPHPTPNQRPASRGNAPAGAQPKGNPGRGNGPQGNPGRGNGPQGGPGRGR